MSFKSDVDVFCPECQDSERGKGKWPVHCIPCWTKHQADLDANHPGAIVNKFMGIPVKVWDPSAMNGIPIQVPTSCSMCGALEGMLHKLDCSRPQGIAEALLGFDETKCECGSEACGSNAHSTYCPKFKE